MPEADGEEMVCHLRSKNADLGDVFAKVNVNGSDAIPLYNYLKYKQPGSFVSLIKWNFTKFLVDKNGQPVARYSPTTHPKEICSEIDKLLEE
jgi:glutathione peroxidase-family protein